jgi:hypothetical protein
LPGPKPGRQGFTQIGDELRGINGEGREGGEFEEKLREEKLLLAIRLDSILSTGGRRSEQKGLSRGSDLFSSKLLYPATHSLSRLLSKIQNDVGILIEIEDGKVFFGVDNNRVLP